jgi:hypothetical protein
MSASGPACISDEQFFAVTGNPVPEELDLVW